MEKEIFTPGIINSSCFLIYELKVFIFQIFNPPDPCELCAKLHEEDLLEKEHKVDLKKWMTQDANCDKPY